MENKKKSPTKLKQQQKTKQMTQINMNLPLKLLNQRFYNNIDPIQYSMEIFYNYYDEYFADKILTLELQYFDVMISIN